MTETANIRWPVFRKPGESTLPNIAHKYATQNRLIRFSIHLFMNSLLRLLDESSAEKMLHVANIGCGDSFISTTLLLNASRIQSLVGLDMQDDALRLSRELYRQNRISQPLVRGTIYSLPFADAQFDLAICSEVLEHLEDLDRAMGELCRITNDLCLLSVPNEPFFRMANVIRGHYLITMGNTPGHIQHFGQNSFIRFVRKYLNVIAVTTPAYLWTMILARKVKVSVYS